MELETRSRSNKHGHLARELETDVELGG